MTLKLGKEAETSATAAAKSLQSCLTLRNPMDCSLPDSSVHGIFQARVLEWGAIAFSQAETSRTLLSETEQEKHSKFIETAGSLEVLGNEGPGQDGQEFMAPAAKEKH